MSVKPPSPGDGDRPSEHDSVQETLTDDGRALHDFLSGTRPFESLSREILSLIRANMTESRFSPGDLLIRQGDPGTSLMVIAEGECEVSVEEHGNRYVLKRVGQGEVLGEMALLTRDRRTASIVALTDVTAWVLSAVNFENLVKQHPKIVTLLTALLASRLGRLHHDAMTGNTFHGYRILSCVGRGGMSVVYEAEHLDSGRRVALKMMSHLLLQDMNARRRFDREAEIVGSFDHPNIAQMYGRFEAFRTSFIVMELCDGISLAAALDVHGILSESDARKILGQVARAVRHAHEAGIVHHDIKPSNIMATRDGTMKLIDFGLAGNPGKEATAGTFYGTPRYMAPEHMAGQKAGAASDLFALGHVAFEMVTGEHIFRSKGFRSLRQEVIECRIPDMARDYPKISAELRHVIEGLLRKIPEERHIDFDLVSSWAAPVDLGAPPDSGARDDPDSLS